MMTRPTTTSYLRQRNATGVVMLAGLLVAAIPTTAKGANKRAGQRNRAGAGSSAPSWGRSARPERLDGMRGAAGAVPPRARTRTRSAQAAISSGSDACMEAYQEARRSERAGALMEAREFWTKCTQPPCNAFLQERCALGSTHLEGDIPSVVLAATDATGAASEDVQVKIDGRLLMASLDGRARGVDPGMHEFSFMMGGHEFSMRKVMVAQGQRNRLITVEIPAAATERLAAVAVPARRGGPPHKLARAGAHAPRPPDESPRHVPAATDSSLSQATHRLPTLALVAGGTGLAALGAGVLLTLWGRQDNAALSQCNTPDAPGLCEQSSIDHIKNLYLAADISLGIGLVATAGAYALYRRSQHPLEESSPEEHLSFNLRPTRQGAVASLGGSF